jgi:hypothetical protein
VEKAEIEVESLERALSNTGTAKTPNEVQTEMQQKDKDLLVAAKTG